MNIETFRRILGTFTDDPDSFQISKGTVVVQLRDTLVEATLKQRDYALFVEEGGVQMPAESWLVRRIARLDLLAERLLITIPEAKDFVTPSGSLLAANTDVETDVSDSLTSIQLEISNKTAGASNVLYLTSNAGEGKTTLINQLARVQAQQFKSGAAHWLLIPVALGGRPFLRFDEVIAGSLMNRFRFLSLFYESFMELVKIGAIVPALDGFEEMFVETAEGEALTALGSLVSSMQSSGVVVIAARKAYFEFSDLGSQAKLFDSLGTDEVCFSRLSLKRWGRTQFLEYASKRGIPNGDQVYKDVAERLGANHSILTRPVLASRLLDVATDKSDRDALLLRLGNSPHDYFYEFVDTIIEREAFKKWIDKGGDTARPLLTVAEHHELLSAIALEMWAQSTDLLKEEIFDLLAEVYCESRKASVQIARQVRQRICQHALIVVEDSRSKTYRFDHEEFKNFFLGEGLARVLLGKDDAEVFRVIRGALLSANALDTLAAFVRRTSADVQAIATRLNSLVAEESTSYYSKENAGGIIIRLLDGALNEDLLVHSLTFGAGALDGRILRNIKFEECTFGPTSLAHSQLFICSFEECTFEKIELPKIPSLKGNTFASCEIQSLMLSWSGLSIFDPEQIIAVLHKHGAQLAVGTAPQLVMEGFEPDEEFRAVEKALLTFQRCTPASEGIFKLRLGPRASLFEKQILPELLRLGVVVEISDSGSGHTRKFRPGASMVSIIDALTKSQGRYSDFLRCFQRSK